MSQICEAITLKGTQCTRKKINSEIYCKTHLNISCKKETEIEKSSIQVEQVNEKVNADDEKYNLRQYSPGEEFIAFYSNAKEPYYKLSNFSDIQDGINIFGELYYSTEHAFQSQKYIEEQRHRFAS